jgi:hypothetical protein
MNRIWQYLFGFSPDQLAGADAWSVGFTAELGGFVRLLLVVVLALMVYLVVRSYRREGEGKRRVKIILATMRLLTVGLVFLILLRPAIILRFVHELRSVVVVLIDDSHSMSFSDRYTSDETRDALEVELGLSAGQLSDLSRSELVARQLGQSVEVLETIAQDHPLMVMAFSSSQPDQPYTRLLGVYDVTQDDSDIAEFISVAAEDLTATGPQTDLSRTVRDVLDRTRGQWVGAMVLITDGQQTVTESDARLQAALDLANQRPVPVHAVMVGDPTERCNLAVTSVYAPDRVRREATTEVTVTITQRNLAGQTVIAYLEARPAEADEDEPVWVTVAEQAVTLPTDSDTPGEGDGQMATVFRFAPEEIGVFEYRVRVEERDNEQDIDDNVSEPMTVTIVDERINVLLVGGSPSWDFQYLRDYLYRQSDTYRVSVWQQNADPEVNQTASTGMELTQLPRALSELTGVPGDPERPGYQVIILMDPQPTENGFDGEFASNLLDYVQLGGGLCYVAGHKYADTILVDPPESFRPLATLLPVTLASSATSDLERLRSDRPQAWRLRLTSYGADHPVTRLGNSSDETAAIWDIMPGIYVSHPVQQLKPGARALVNHSNPARRTSRGHPEPIVATHSLRGNVLYVGTGESWRWRALEDAYYHRRFWSNAIRFLAADGAAKRYRISSGGDRFEAGETITIDVEAYDELFLPITTDTLTITVVDLETGEEIPLGLPAVDVTDEPGRYRGALSEALSIRPGRYHLTVRGEGENFDEIVAGRDILIELPRAESRSKEADETTLRLIGMRSSAAGAAGNFLYLHQLDQLADRIPPDRLTTVHEVRIEFWDTPMMMALVVLLLTTEWILRKRFNMA